MAGTHGTFSMMPSDYPAGDCRHAETRARGTTCTLISEGALYEAEKHRRALGESTPITREDLWARSAEDMSENPCKGLGIDLLGTALRDRDQAIDTFIACSHRMESAALDDREAGPKVFLRLRAAAVNEGLGRHLVGLDHAIAQNEALAEDAIRLAETNGHLRALRAEAAAALRQLDAVERNANGLTPTRGPSL